MDELLGLVVLAVYIVGVVGLAALVTFVVVKLFPTERGTPAPAGEAPSTNGPGAAGRLFRRAKRGTA